jgi:DNA-binding beta-propeller fold protein YncE
VNRPILHAPFFGALFLILCTTGVIRAQNIDMDAVSALEEFRWGVRAYHNRNYNDAILSLSRSLSYKPEDQRTRYWLGRAYYYSGLEDAALSEWRGIVDSGRATSHLLSLIETLEVRRGLGPERSGPERYVQTVEIRGRTAENTMFRGPVAVKPRLDGGFYLVSYSTHEIHVFDVNGVIRRTLQGGLEGFDRPYDLVEAPDGTLYVSEFGANRVARVTPSGSKTATFGGRGISDGNLLGPQYLAIDDDGAVYVSDWGNRRVVKYDREGVYLLSFGTQTRGYSGLRNPTGIVFHQNRIFVADSHRRDLSVFDTNGNFLYTIRDLGLNGPEMLSVYDENKLIVSDGNGIVLLDVGSELVSRDVAVESVEGTITSAVKDRNGNIVAVEFETDRILILTPVSSLYAGLVTRIDRAYTDAFPEIVLEVTVEDRFGNPVVGLRGTNFVITEDGYNVGGGEHLFSAYRSDRAEIALVTERSIETQSRAENLSRAAEDLFEALGGRGRIRVVSAGETPGIQAGPETGRLEMVRAATAGGGFSRQWNLDLALRLAGSGIMESPDRRAVVFVTSGNVPDHAFDRYGVREIAHYLRTNGIRFYPVYQEPSRHSEELEYIARETGGESVYLYGSEGLRALIAHIFGQPEGRYTLRYRSVHDSDFGRRYIPVEVEALLAQRSGRDEAGYFAPLEF